MLTLTFLVNNNKNYVNNHQIINNLKYSIDYSAYLINLKKKKLIFLLL